MINIIMGYGQKLPNKLSNSNANIIAGRVDVLTSTKPKHVATSLVFRDSF